MRDKRDRETIEKLKEATGIETANCETCIFLGYDDNGDDLAGVVEWPICDADCRLENLKSFPFKKEMLCWGPNFWASKFVDMIDGIDESVDKAFLEFREAVESIDSDYFQVTGDK